MLFDWILREGWVLPVWWLLVTLAGAAVMPLCWRLLGRLPDKGYTLSRALGLLLVGFVYWLLASYGFLDNGAGGMVMAWLIVLCLSLLAFVRLKSDDDTFNVCTYWRENKKIIIAAEVLFIVLFASLTVYRAFQNDTGSTEKPMELAFISGIMRSETFPPNDPWMAGYSISYYYFGYVLAAMLSTLSNVSSGVGFSMTIALWFGLTGVTVFGVVSNLVRSRITRRDENIQQSHTPAITTGILAAVFVLLLGNFQFALVELPFQAQSVPESYMDFWGVQSRSFDDYGAVNPFADDAAASDNNFVLTDPATWTTSGWWWFRASRVLTDYNLDGTVAGHAQPISEFPAFSFVLADVHPHVLSLPFVMVAVGMAFNLVLGAHAPNRYEVTLYAVMIGGLMFLNSWDAPIYLALFVGAEALRRLIASGRGRLGVQDWAVLVAFGALLIGIAWLAYLPFFVGFRSQAAGLLPNLAHPTLFRRFFIMFGPLLLLSGAFLAVEAWRGSHDRRMNWSLGITVAGLALFSLLAFSGLMLLLAALFPQNVQFIVSYVQANGGWSTVIPALLARRVTYGLTSLVLLVAIVVIVARLFPRHRIKRDENDSAVTYPAATGFALLLLGVAVSLTLVPDFVYLRDNFSVRINTVFKFYYQAWIALSIVSAYGVYTLLEDIELPRPAPMLRGGFVALLVTVSIAGLLYSAMAFYTRGFYETGYTRGTGSPLTLDGRSAMPQGNDDYPAILCLADLVQGDDAIIAEAVRDAYRSHYARVASITGIPSLIGWENHERQWRGATYPQVAGSRADDIDRLFSDLRWDVAQPILAQYDIDYIFYGTTERNQYGAEGEEKFAERLPVVCESGDTRVYAVDDDLLDPATLR